MYTHENRIVKKLSCYMVNCSGVRRLLAQLMIRLSIFTAPCSKSVAGVAYRFNLMVYLDYIGLVSFSSRIIKPALAIPRAPVEPRNGNAALP